MNDTTGKYQSFELITFFMEQDFKEKVVRQAITSFSKISIKSSTSLKDAITKYVAVKSFRPQKTLTAPLPILSKSVARELNNNNELAKALLTAWYESQTDLAETVKRHLTKMPEIGQAGVDWEKGFPLEWPSTQMVSLSEDIKSSNPGWSPS